MSTWKFQHWCLVAWLAAITFMAPTGDTVTAVWATTLVAYLVFTPKDPPLIRD